MNQDRTSEAPGSPDAAIEFQLGGGLLEGFGLRWGLTGSRAGTVRLGLLIGLLLWGVLMLLAWSEGALPRLFSLSLLSVHVNLLIAIPLFFVCEAQIAPQMAAFSRSVVKSGVVPQQQIPAFAAEIERLTRIKNHPVTEVTCFVVALLLTLLVPAQLFLPQEGVAVLVAEAQREEAPLATFWYWFVCVTIFRFLVLRWALRLLLWWHFLWRLPRLKLHLQPLHPDRTGGLGTLEVVHLQFAPLALAIAATDSAVLAQRIAADPGALLAFKSTLLLLLLFNFALFVLPLWLLAPALRSARNAALHDFGLFGSRYVRGFAAKWIESKRPPDGELLGTSDLQSLSDLSGSYEVVRSMRPAPMSLRLALAIGGATALPVGLLLLFQYPVMTLVEGLLKSLSGL